MRIQIYLICEESHPSTHFYLFADSVTHSWILSWCQQNVQAGSDSTAITLTSIIYHLLKYPESMKLLLDELHNANLPSPVSWDSVHSLPYLDACIKEALRMTPALGIPLERVAPEQGLELCGHYFKPGTVLGVNAWVVHRDRETYGEDADSWNPTRWSEVSKERRKDMERTLFAVSTVSYIIDFFFAKRRNRKKSKRESNVGPGVHANSLLQFGGGTRVCLGKNISYLEMYKVIPELLLRFKVFLLSSQMVRIEPLLTRSTPVRAQEPQEGLGHQKSILHLY